MDTEQQIRLNFLDEAEEYLDRMETSLIGFADAEIDPQTVDLVLRAAHSIKGGAAMMGFDILSRVAHRLEDFFKILRVRYASSQIETEIETLLLQSIDCLREIKSLYRQGIEVAESDISDRIQPIFERLHSHLGDLEIADENALLAQDEDLDPGLLIFEEGVDGVLDRFETKLSELNLEELAQELSATAVELTGFGHMADLAPFIQLCKSIQNHAAVLSTADIGSLSAEALKVWRRSHALVLRGSIDKLPSHLEGYESVRDNSEAIDRVELETESEFNPLAIDSSAFTQLQSAFDLGTESESNPLAMDDLELTQLQSAFELNNSNKEETAKETAIQPEKVKPAVSLPQKSSAVERVEKMVRVPISQLKQFNTLFEQLVLNRNTINLRLEQLQSVVILMSQRMSQMESSNTQLKQWYDRASIQGLLREKEVEVLVSSSSSLKTKKRDSFDDLEMDRYSDIHLICQEQIETIVQLQEVATDIELRIGEIHQSARDLHYTTKSMQGNVTRTQMLPFADAVKRLPRIIRDLNLKFDKQASLKIVGETTLLDRSVVEVLNDPLMHLLRNSFDHGIEEPKARLAAGKPESGTITIQAQNVGTYTLVTISDDGAGINLDKIRDRVVKMGLSTVEVAQITDKELLEFIFEPGFSTAQQVTQLSGRGVGMDVVRTNLQEVRGDVRVDTKPGEGTTFTLKIPFSLSILRVAIVEQDGIIFAIPANNIRELITSAPEAMLTPDNPQKVFWNETEIPLVEVEKILVFPHSHNKASLSGNPTINQTMTLVVGDNKSFAALKISRFWNEQESTIKSIDSPVPLAPGIVSSVVFGDGKVIPLVNPIALVEETLRDDFDENLSDSVLTESNNAPLIKTILVVDDSINVRRYLTMTLEKSGYRVEQAKDGREAVDKLVGGLTVQGVICDVEMPRLDGYGVLEEIKERSEFTELPIAMLTSRSNEKHRKLAMNLGASAYFSKPYNEQQLLEKLTEIIN